MRAAVEPARPSADAASELRRAIIRTIAYADVFDYPLDRREIHRYLIGEPASADDVDRALEGDLDLQAAVGRTGELFHLRGRESTVGERRRREASSADLWRVARRYGSWIARLPLVRFAAVTGALAMNNAERGADVDVFVLAKPGRVWLCRLLALAVVRIAALRGHTVCPNFILSTDRLLLDERNVFTAHEVVQMVPLRATRWHAEFLAANDWVREHLPNADLTPGASVRPSLFTRIADALLASPLFSPLERWEMARKIRRLSARAKRGGGSLAFTADQCRGHFAAHDVRVLAAYRDRLTALGYPP